MTEKRANNVRVLFRWTDGSNTRRSVVIQMPQAPAPKERVDFDFHEGENIRAVTLHVVERRWQIVVADDGPAGETIRATLTCELVSEKVVDK